jgi:hypothetical protein
MNWRGEMVCTAALSADAMLADAPISKTSKAAIHIDDRFSMVSLFDTIRWHLTHSR